jgi:DNA repair exonuclease SbcCD nuclease subunit
LIEKFEYVLEYAAETNSKIIHGGDLFHTPSVPDFVATRIVRLFKKYESEVYFIIGNHDVTGGNVESYDYSKIGLMAEYKFFHLLAKQPVLFEDSNEIIMLCGYDYSKKMECPEIIDPKRDFKIDKDIPIICVVHSMIVNDLAVVIEGKFKTINWKSINMTANTILTGHYHPGFGIQKDQLGGEFINPGAMARLEASKSEIVREPKFALYINGKWSLKPIPFKKNVFDLRKMEIKSSSEEEKNKFIEALNNLKDEDLAGNNILKILDNIKNMEVSDELKDCLTNEIIEKCRIRIEDLKNG